MIAIWLRSSAVYFLDTSYILALELSSDQYHTQAQQHWQALLPTVPQLVTTSFVFDEVVTFFNTRSYHTKAQQLGNMMLTSTFITLHFVHEPLFQQGWAYFQHHTDKTYSLTDCISFVVMHENGITTALTFDHHFTQAGFQREPRL
jgi:uncharacterized protein